MPSPIVSVLIAGRSVHRSSGAGPLRSKPMYQDRSSYFAEDDVGRVGFYAVVPSQRSQIRSGRSAMPDAGRRARSTDLALQLR